MDIIRRKLTLDTIGTERVKNLSGKMVNFCKWIPKAENVTVKQLFSSVILRPQ